MGMYRHKMPDRELSEEMTKADNYTGASYWEVQAYMWHQNYKEAINDVERLFEQAHSYNENVLKKDVEIESLRDALRWAAPYVKDDPRVSEIIKATLKEEK